MTKSRTIASELPGFRHASVPERRATLGALLDLGEAEREILEAPAGLAAEQADLMIENAIGAMGLPLGLCLNLHVDGRDRLVPMAIEEPSVVAAASFAAKLLRAGGGVRTELTAPHMIGQIQLLDVEDMERGEQAIAATRAELLAQANACDPVLVAAGGGAADLEIRRLAPLESGDPAGPMLVVHLVVDVRDAMGANLVNAMCESLGPRLASLAGGRVGLRIVSNLADRRLAVAWGHVPLSALAARGGHDPERLARDVEQASAFAERDPYRAATHNKGIMNGIDAVLVAFGQDWRAVEAGAHAFAARSGRYTALSRWRVREGALHGRLELPLAVGTVGGISALHPTVRLARRLAEIRSAAELASVAAAVGLAQNLGALRALVTEGICRGYRRQHARAVAARAGADVGPPTSRFGRVD
ncbi:MAG: hydroxymethylglutaryl-CoA reductase, degradative [Deltaproteobacteria bacterium]|nr:hydroxymethylglutaryl-CoA reductase, degradative [Deltaproteobacteria bacterium]